MLQRIFSFGRQAAHPSDGGNPYDRMSVVTWVLVFGLILSLLVEAPATLVKFTALGSPVALEFSAGLWMAVVLALAAAAGTESIIRTHPRYRVHRNSLTWAYWALPMAITIITVLVLPAVPTSFLQVLVVVTAGILLAFAFNSLYLTVESGQVGFRRARLVLNVLTYGAALLLFLFVYQTRIRSLVSSTLVGVTATLLAIELLRTWDRRAQLVLAYGLIVGLLLGQVTWALNYWPLLPGLTGGLLLLLTFYLSVIIAQHGLQERLTRRLLLELVIFTLIALALIVLFAPGFVRQEGTLPLPPLAP